jgi:hypothetical protein
MNLQSRIIESKRHLGANGKLVEGAVVYVTEKGRIYKNKMPTKNYAFKIYVKKGVVNVEDAKGKKIEPIGKKKSVSKLRGPADEKVGEDT